MLPVEIWLIILYKYPLKSTRLICSSFKNEIQNKYWENMIVTYKNIVDYIKSNEDVFTCLTYGVYKQICGGSLKIGTEYLCHNYLISNNYDINNVYKIDKSEYKDVLTSIYINRKKDLDIDIVNKYKILKNRFNNKKYYEIIKNKILDHLKFHQLGIYNKTICVFMNEYIWLIVNYYIILLDDTIIENFIDNLSLISNIVNVQEKINLLRPNAKHMYKFIYDYINTL